MSTEAQLAELTKKARADGTWEMAPDKKAELLELRATTPEIEAANAAAAKAIEEVAAKAAAAPEAERKPAMGIMRSFWDSYGGPTIAGGLGHTPLVDLEFLILLARLGGRLPCGRQNMPPAALITKRNAWRIKLWAKKKKKFTIVHANTLASTHLLIIARKELASYKRNVKSD